MVITVIVSVVLVVVSAEVLMSVDGTLTVVMRVMVVAVVVVMMRKMEVKGKLKMTKVMM